ncbi:hypothetical protein Tco_1316102 [Tanacetum coccineum]
MGDENPIRTLGDYSKPNHGGYRNTIKLPVGNNVVPLRSDTIRLVKMDAHSTDFNSMAPKSIASISHVESEELRKKGIKRPSKLFSPKYLSTASIKELNKNPSAPKCVYFVNLIVILSKDCDTEEDVSSTNVCRHDLDTTSITDHCLGEMVFGRPFIDETDLVYNKEEGTVMFKQDNEKIKFKMPHTMEIFKQTRLMGASTDSIPLLAYEENFSNGRTHYYQSLLIGDEYKQDEGDRRGVRNLIRLEKEIRDNKGEVT